MQVKDDRTVREKFTHSSLVIGVDTFMSGWGKAPARSYAGWACRPEHEKQVLRWVRDRGDIKSVRIQDRTYLPTGSNKNHCHIYVVNEGHNALATGATS